MNLSKILFSKGLSVLMGVVIGAQAFQADQLAEPECLEVHDLCLAFEKAYTTLSDFQGRVYVEIDGRLVDVTVSAEQVCKAVSIMREVKVLKEDRKKLMNTSADQLEQIKIRLVGALKEIEMLKKGALKEAEQSFLQKNSVYKEWVKVVFKMAILSIVLHNVSTVPVVHVPLAVMQLYFVIRFFKETFNVLQDVTDRIFTKIW